MARRLNHRRPGGYVAIDHVLLDSKAYRDLKPAAKALLIEFANRYRPGRNGYISISVREAEKLVRASRRTVELAFKSLVEHGFIVMTNPHHWQNGRAREWRLTFQPGANNTEPTDEWERWRPSSRGTEFKH